MTRKELKPGIRIVARDLSGVPCWYVVLEVIDFVGVDGTTTRYVKVEEEEADRFIPQADCFDTKADCLTAAQFRIRILAEEICTLLGRAPSVKSIRVGREHTSIYIKS